MRRSNVYASSVFALIGLILASFVLLASQPEHVYAQAQQTETSDNTDSPSTDQLAESDQEKEEVGADQISQRWIDRAQGREQPPMLTPWREGTAWSYTGGPHTGYLDGRFAALDFAPPDSQGCYSGQRGVISNEWVLSSTPGIVVTSGNGEVRVDMDGDGNPSTGWSAFYYHMSDTDRIKQGTVVFAGDRLGRVDCVYGRTDGTHLHFARLRDGVFISAIDAEAPFNISGWTFTSFGNDYAGAAVDPNGVTQPKFTVITSDNGPETRAKVFGNQPTLLGKNFAFRIPVDWFRPGPLVTQAELMGAFRDGRLRGKNALLLPVASRTRPEIQDDGSTWKLVATKDAAVRPAASGTVKEITCEEKTCTVTVEHPTGHTTIYSNLSNEQLAADSAILVGKDEEVTKDTALGRVGSDEYITFSIVGKTPEDAVMISEYFNPNLLEKAGMFEDRKEWEWDVPYRPSDRDAAEYIAASQSGNTFYAGYLILGVIAVLFLYGLRKANSRKSQPRPEGPAWYEGIRSGIIRFISWGVTAVLLLITWNLLMGGGGMGIQIPGLPAPPVAKRLSPSQVLASGEINIPWLPATVMHWDDKIIVAANKHGIWPELLGIIVTVESGGGACAGSGAGARGLGQVMPATGAEIAQNQGITGFTPDDLWNPDTNLDFSAYYLAKQRKAYGYSDDPDSQKTVEIIAIAYNGGPGRAINYKNGQQIPSETQAYVKWVGGMWRERHELTSPTFDEWSAAGGQVLIDQAAAWQANPTSCR